VQQVVAHVLQYRSYRIGIRGVIKVQGGPQKMTMTVRKEKLKAGSGIAANVIHQPADGMPVIQHPLFDEFCFNDMLIRKSMCLLDQLTQRLTIVNLFVTDMQIAI
jgi:hypothetical protein